MQTEVVRQVLSLAHHAVKETHRDRLEAYIQTYCRAIPPEVLSEIEPHNLLAFVMDRFAFLEEDFGKTVKVVLKDPGTALLVDEATSTVIETRLPDCSFVIRTIKAFLRQMDLTLQFVLHPIHGVIADHGQITGIDPVRGTKYSQVYMQVSPIAPDKREGLRHDLEQRLELLLLVNRDRFDMMKRLDETRAFLCGLAKLDPSIPSPRESQGIPKDVLTAGVERSRTTTISHLEPRERESNEAVQMIDWLKDDNFVLTGYAWFPTGNGHASKAERGLGLFAAPPSPTTRTLEEVIGEIAATRLQRDEIYSFYRTDYMTMVRSVTQLRYFGVQEPGKGEHVFVGLLSTKALKQANRRVPVAGKRIRDTMAKLEDQPGSYTYTKSVAILDSLPVEDLFYWTIDELGSIAEQFRLAEARDQARVFVWRRPNGRRVSVVCVVPRMRFSEALKAEASEEIRKFLQVPQLREYRQETDEESPIRLHFTVGKYRAGVGDADLEKLGEHIEKLLESWDDQLREQIFKRYRGRSEIATQSRYLATTASAQDIWTRFGSRFPESYKGTNPPEIGLLDIGLFEKLDDDSLRAGLAVLGEGGARYTSLRIASRKELLLNDVVPSLHRMALRATSRLAERLLPGHGPDAYITAFEVTGMDGRKIEDDATLERLGTIVQRVLVGQLADDRLLGLGYLAGLDWRQIDLLVTYRNYFVQVFQGFGTHTVNDALLKHPQFATLLVEYFETKFATQRPETPAVRSEKLLPPLAAKYDDMLDAVTVIQEDLILRYFIDLFEATRRTNYYRPGRVDAISIKIESALVEHMPRPCPLYEIYVHAPGVEGIHLRGGKVARGGIRHSDRADDFRTEVLGLQRTQGLKNVVIVPQGAKGGFVTRKATPTRDEARAQYEVFIAGLLDVTDNYVGTGIAPPPGVLRYDEDDPYLVVAADKGTAHLSDTANGISLRYKFWLDDAFASGGSAGYDHKEMGITSRGGWTNVERHFREMGTDIRKTSIKVAGVGDMGGDVFGNGMLLNDQMRVVAAFNHKHVFLDPDPDATKSYSERKRLFNTPGTQWSDYNKDTLSKGGGVFERAAKEIELSPEAKKMLGLNAPIVTGPDIVRAILTLDVDLMWFGGIGTYVKATTEAHGEVGDKVNDNVRVNALDLRAKVIGEGANLAITQRGRTEYAMHGGRCNTDAIDNSAGVDCSDHEVNLKILFAPLMATSQITREARDKLLRELEPDVAAACVQDNYLQAALLSMAAIRTKKHGELFLDVLTYLDKHGLNRAAEHIPPDDELRTWIAAGKQPPRNLIAVLIAHIKNDLYGNVLTSRIPDLPLFQPFLVSYFPPRAAQMFPEQVNKHHLRREIIATVVTNAVVNQAGGALLISLCKESAQPIEEHVIRYFICDELLGGRGIRAAIHGADYKVAAADQYAALIAFEEIHRGLLRWWIWNEASWKLAPEQVPAFKSEFEAAGAALVDALEGSVRSRCDARKAEVAKQGFGADVVNTLARAPLLAEAFALIAAARDAKAPLKVAAPAFHRAGRELHLDTFDEVLALQIPANAWERRFFISLEREAAAVRQRAVGKLIPNGDFVERNRERIDRIGDALQMVRTLGAHGLVPLFLILEDYRALS